MKCNVCKEQLDNRDIIRDSILSCWKCGSKRELTPDELYTYKPSKINTDSDPPDYYHYLYEG